MDHWMKQFIAVVPNFFCQELVQTGNTTPSLKDYTFKKHLFDFIVLVSESECFETSPDVNKKK